jgi:hypothetical protein
MWMHVTNRRCAWLRPHEVCVTTPRRCYGCVVHARCSQIRVKGMDVAQSFHSRTSYAPLPHICSWLGGGQICSQVLAPRHGFDGQTGVRTAT